MMAARLKTITVLVIGYGNTLRGDDGVGYQVAETVAEWQLPQVRSIAVHQLLPELAADIAEVDLVIFVDAVVATAPAKQDITITPIFAGGDENFSTHIFVTLGDDTKAVWGDTCCLSTDNSRDRFYLGYNPVLDRLSGQGIGFGLSQICGWSRRTAWIDRRYY
jgi:hypothetical protein